MIVKRQERKSTRKKRFESSVNSYDSQTIMLHITSIAVFESSVNSYDSQTTRNQWEYSDSFESSVNSYDSQTK